MSTTGERLIALREKLGKSQAQIAELIGVDRTSYAKYETNINKPTRKLKELSDLFGVTSDYIMCLSDDPHGSPFTGQVDGQFLTFAPEPIKPEELALLEAYRKASDRDKNIIDTILKPSVRDKGKEVG